MHWPCDCYPTAARMGWGADRPASQLPVWWYRGATRLPNTGTPGDTQLSNVGGHHCVGAVSLQIYFVRNAAVADDNDDGSCWPPSGLPSSGLFWQLGDPPTPTPAARDKPDVDRVASHCTGRWANSANQPRYQRDTLLARFFDRPGSSCPTGFRPPPTRGTYHGMDASGICCPEEVVFVGATLRGTSPVGANTYIGMNGRFLSYASTSSASPCSCPP